MEQKNNESCLAVGMSEARDARLGCYFFKLVGIGQWVKPLQNGRLVNN